MPGTGNGVVQPVESICEIAWPYEKPIGRGADVLKVGRKARPCGLYSPPDGERRSILTCVFWQPWLAPARHVRVWPRSIPEGRLRPQGSSTPEDTI